MVLKLIRATKIYYIEIEKDNRSNEFSIIMEGYYLETKKRIYSSIIISGDYS